MVYGAIIGGIGTLIGAILGVLFSLVIGDLVAGLEQVSGAQLLRSDVYPISYLPTDIRASDVAIVSGAAYFYECVCQPLSRMACIAARACAYPAAAVTDIS